MLDQPQWFSSMKISSYCFAPFECCDYWGRNFYSCMGISVWTVPFKARRWRILFHGDEVGGVNPPEVILGWGWVP